jgi:hypothetical protein
VSLDRALTNISAIRFDFDRPYIFVGGGMSPTNMWRIFVSDVAELMNIWGVWLTGTAHLYKRDLETRRFLFSLPRAATSIHSKLKPSCRSLRLHSSAPPPVAATTIRSLKLPLTTRPSRSRRRSAPYTRPASPDLQAPASTRLPQPGALQVIAQCSTWPSDALEPPLSARPSRHPPATISTLRELGRGCLNCFDLNELLWFEC